MIINHTTSQEWQGMANHEASGATQARMQGEEDQEKEGEGRPAHAQDRGRAAAQDHPLRPPLQGSGRGGGAAVPVYSPAG